MTAILHLFCGKIAAGKSTLAADLAQAPGTVLIRQDFWLSGLFGEEMRSIQDYVRYAGRLQGVIGPHVVDLLRAGMSVVLDFPANTAADRAWMRGLFELAGAEHRLHLLEVDDAVCKARLRRRNTAGNHEFAVTDAQYDRMMRHFAPPGPEEGYFRIVRHPAS